MSSDSVVPYSLLGVLVASTNSSASSYGDPVDLDFDHMFTVASEHDTDMLRDSGAVVRGLSVVTHGTLEINAGGLPFDALIVTLGASANTSGARKRRQRKTGINRPYFGAIGFAYADDDQVVVIGLPKCQVQNDPEVSFDGTTNAFITSKMTGAAFVVGEGFDVWDTYATFADWEAAKPTDGAEFLAFFA